MLPVGSFSDFMYPMTADIYYASYTQNDIGEMESNWEYNRTVKCSVIKERPSSTIANAIQSNKIIEFELQLDFRVEENILISDDNTSYPVTDVLIQNIKDPNGTIVWFEERQDESTKFEIQNIEPMFDPFHVVFGYRILLKRADDQDVSSEN
jgi:hypothetical protein